MAPRLNAVLTNPLVFKDIVDSMKDLVKDILVDMNESGLQVQCPDTSNVGLVHLMMREKCWESFSCTQPITVGVNAESLGKILKLCGPTDKLIMEYSEEADKSRTLDFTFENPQDQRKAKFSMKTVEVQQDALGVPDVPKEAVVTLPAAEFKKTVSELKDVGDNLSLHASAEGLKCAVDGEMGFGFVLLQPREGGEG